MRAFPPRLAFSPHVSDTCGKNTKWGRKSPFDYPPCFSRGIAATKTRRGFNPIAYISG